MKILLGWLILGCVCVTGCTKLNSEFDCPAPSGGSCKRMDQVYNLINGEGGVAQESLAVAPSRNPLIVEGRPGDPLRYGEGVMRVWIAPYEDTEGNYHQASQVYSVVQKGHWIQNPPVASK
ncbi:type IV conjugative transfer system lipoprotein TraV [uncultured Legionella sp.]|uniref:type IV conjugative transfer system lipoprotein TraV n=1 Tax=uncultured Legionella sp. TaxID=210934 RepID=UPI0026137878|nr:type IV conjugative transfer system lipoprotein TraV [uncultured Legionella sp.]